MKNPNQPTDPTTDPMAAAFSAALAACGWSSADYMHLIATADALDQRLGAFLEVVAREHRRLSALTAPEADHGR